MEESNVVFVEFSGTRNFQKEKQESEVYSPKPFTQDVQKGDDIEMSKNEYITHKELNHLEEKIDLKFDNVNSTIDGAFKLTNEKINHMQEITNSKMDNLPIVFKNMLLEEREYQATQKKETQRFLWGTIGIGIVGIIISVASILISLR